MQRTLRKLTQAAPNWEEEKKENFSFLNLGIIKLYKEFACFDVTNNINMSISVDFFLTVVPVFKPDRKKPACSYFKLMHQNDILTWTNMDL